MRLRLMLAVLAVSLVSVVPIARAQSDLDRAREDVAAVTERLEDLLDEVEGTQERGDELTRRYWQVQSNLQRLELDIVAGERASAELDTARVGLVEQVRLLAIDRYVSRREEYNIADFESEADRAAAEALARVLVGNDHAAIDQLAASNDAIERQVEALETQREEQRGTLADVESTQSELLGELEQLGELRDALAGELASLENALGELEAAEEQRQQEAAERQRLAEERERAQAAAAAARAQVRAPSAPIPTVPPAPPPVAVAASPTAVPNPQPSQPLQTATVAPGTAAVPNPQPGQPFPTATGLPAPAAATPIPNPQPSQPFPTIAAAPEPTTAAPNPQPSVPLVSGGAMLCPLAGPFTHTDDFNSPRAVGGIHRANDLISASGTPVIAVVAGQIEHKNSSVGGLSAHLRADNGDYYFFTHLSGYANEGAGHVAAGTVIGYVGMTGNAPIPHLHFEIHVGGRGNYTNPYGPVRAACF